MASNQQDDSFDQSCQNSDQRGEESVQNRDQNNQTIDLEEKIFVGGLTPDISNADIQTFFEQFGNVLTVETAFDLGKNQRKNFCFVVFESKEVANEALKVPKQIICGREVDVRKAQRKINNDAQTGGRGRPPRGGHRGRGPWGGSQSFNNQRYGGVRQPGFGQGGFEYGNFGYGNFGYGGFNQSGYGQAPGYGFPNFPSFQGGRGGRGERGGRGGRIGRDGRGRRGGQSQTPY